LVSSVGAALLDCTAISASLRSLRGILIPRVLTESILVALGMLVSLGDRHVIHAFRVVVITSIVSILIRALDTILFFILVRALIIIPGLSLRHLMGAIRINLILDTLKTLFLDISLTLRLAETSVSAQVHGVAVSIAILSLIDLSPWWSVLGLTWRQDGLLHHDLVLILLILVLEISPLGQDLHSLDVFDGCQLFSVVLVATKCIQVDFLA